MERVLTVAERIFFTLEPAAETALVKFAGGSGGREYLLGQFSGSVWAYPLDDGIRLITKPFTATARLITISAGEALLTLVEIEPTTPREVTTVFREGQKIVAEWSLLGNDDGERKGSEGAWALWRALRGEDEPGLTPIPASSPKPPEAKMPPAAKEAKAGEEDEKECILSQTEIDRLITGLKYKEIDTSGCKEDVEAILGEAHQKQGESSSPPAADYFETYSQAGWEFPAAEQGEGAVSTGGFSAKTLQDLPEEGQREGTGGFLEGIDLRASSFSLTGSSQSLAELIGGRPYTVVVFKHRESFERELAIWREKMEGTLMALWAGDPILIQLGPRTQAHLEELRSTAKGAAAFIETNKDRIRRLEQILPNMEEYRKKQEVLYLEASEVAGKMKAFRLNQVMGTHEGRYLAKKIFVTEAHKQAVSKKLAVATNQVFRRSTPWARSRFTKLHTRFLIAQRELEACFEKLSNLEREAQRRLEYQSDWQELEKKQVEIKRELGETARLMAMAAEIPAEVTDNTEAIERWLASEREILRRRDEFLHKWMDCLTEKKAWIARTLEEPCVVFGDEPLLSLPGVVCGAHLVIVTEEGVGAAGGGLPGGCQSCADWVITDATFKVIETGQGLGQMMEPVSSLVEELARRMGIEPEEAMRTLGLLDTSRADGQSMEVV